MPSLFENAVASIRMGVEDYGQQDADRDISAVRNFYAGVLLLAKEALIRAAPNADPQHVIGAKLKPVSDGKGGIEMAQVGHTTVDFQQIGERAADFGISLDHKALKALNTIRNDMEHHYTSSPATAIRSAIAKGFPVASSLFRQMKEDPAEHLGDVWTTMLETTDLYNHEVAEAKATLANVAWVSETVANASFKCSECGAELLGQVDPENTKQSHVEFRCRGCQATPDVEDVIEATVEQELGHEVYINYKDAGEEGPIYECPSCQRQCYIDREGACANCGEELDYDSECARCSNGISIREYLDGNDSGLCGYCKYVMEKDD